LVLLQFIAVTYVHKIS